MPREIINIEMVTSFHMFNCQNVKSQVQNKKTMMRPFDVSRKISQMVTHRQFESLVSKKDILLILFPPRICTLVGNPSPSFYILYSIHTFLLLLLLLGGFLQEIYCSIGTQFHLCKEDVRTISSGKEGMTSDDVIEKF